MTATVSATLLTTGEPVHLTKPDGTPVVYITAKEPDATRKWEMWGVSVTARASIGRLGHGDTVEVRGGLAVKLEAGLAVLQINVVECQMRLPIAPEPKAPKPGSCGKGTMMASRSGVEAADREWHERTASNQ
jgi:hypothetical protein